MRQILNYFIKYPVLGNALLVMIFMFGFFSYSNLKTTFFPDIPSRNIMVTASYPGASPEEIEEGITLKIEDNLKGITGVDRVTSTSSENFASINVELRTGYDANDLLIEVKNAVDRVSSFPVGMEKINVYKLERTDFVLAFTISGDVDLTTLKKHARRVERDLLNNDKISKVSISGFPDEEIEISVRETDMRAYGLTFSQVANAVGQANIKITGGTIKGVKEEFLIRADEKGYHAEELQNLAIKSTADGTIIRLKDVANIIDRWSEDPNRFYMNGKSSVVVDVSKTNDEDMFEIAGILKSYMADFNEKHSDVQTAVLFDGSQIIQERVDILSSNGFIGILLVLLFLGLTLNVRMSFWVALSIPLSFAGMFMLGAFYGLTINVMSLMAMILVIGILVDDGIVIAENIYQHYERGEKPMKAAINGTMEVLPSVTSAILTTVVIFMTFFFLEGGLGDRAGDMAFVVISTLVISLVEAVFILPAHIAHSKALRQNPEKQGRFEKKSEQVMHWLRDRLYAPVLRYAMKHPVVTISVPFAFLFITIGAINGGIVKTTFFPNIEMGSLNVSLEMPAGTPANITDDLLAGMEKKVWTVNQKYEQLFPGSENLIQNIGRVVGRGTHEGSLRITLMESELREISSVEITNLIRETIGPVPGAENLQVGSGGGHWGKPVSIALKSPDLSQLRQAKKHLQSELKSIDRLKDVVNNDPPGLREVKVQLKPKALSLGLTTSEVLAQVRGGFYGQEAQRIIRGIDEVRIWVRYAENERATIDQLENMRIRRADGSEYPLREIAELSMERGIMNLFHIDGERVIKIEADVASKNESVPDIIADIRADIMPEIMKAYPNVAFDFEGQNRENKKTMAAFGRVVPPILVLMFIIVVFTFRSFMQGFLIYLLIPFSLIGVAWGHFLQGYIMSMLSMFGMIALMGIVVNDSLVFVSAMNRYLKDGLKFEEALFKAGLSRFRPVLLTSVTTIAGLAPLIFESSHQAQFLSPMAISVAYGLLFATLLTLVMLPALLMAANRGKLFLYKNILRKKISAEMAEPAVREELFAVEN